jgi:hypothetical protein
MGVYIDYTCHSICNNRLLECIEVVLVADLLVPMLDCKASKRALDSLPGGLTAARSLDVYLMIFRACRGAAVRSRRLTLAKSMHYRNMPCQSLRASAGKLSSYLACPDLSWP